MQTVYLVLILAALVAVVRVRDDAAQGEHADP